MKWIFAIVFSASIVFMMIAEITIPKQKSDAVAILTWATDANPARDEQMQIFRDWYKNKYHEKIDIRIDPANYEFSKIVVQSLSGAGPDIFDYFSCDDLERYISSGIILDVTDDARQNGFSHEKVWEGAWPSFTADGKQYGFPDNVCNSLLIYNKNCFDDAKVPYPPAHWTWAQFLETARKLTYNRPSGLKQFAALYVYADEMMLSNGAHMYSSHGTHCTMDSPEGIEAYQFFEDLRSKYHVMPSSSELASRASAGGWGGGSINVFATGYFGMVEAGRWWYIAFTRDTKQALQEGKPAPYNLGVTTVPYFKHETGGVAARCSGINRNSKNIKYAKRFLEYLAGESFNKQINRTFDAMAPVKSDCTGPTGIADGPAPLPGLESANDSLWAGEMVNARTNQTSPFIPPYRTSFFWREMSEALDAGATTPEQGLRTFVKLVNEEIQRNINRDPALHKLYDQALAQETAEQRQAEMPQVSAAPSERKSAK